MGLFQLMKLGFSGPLAGWMKMVFVFIMIEAVFLYWSIYEFFVAADMEVRVFWGFITVFLGLMIGLQKTWYWMHIYFLWGRQKDDED